jgi:hypothetical protein
LPAPGAAIYEAQEPAILGLCSSTPRFASKIFSVKSAAGGRSMSYSSAAGGAPDPVGAGSERDDFSLNRHPALASCLSMIFSENRCTLFGIML